MQTRQARRKSRGRSDNERRKGRKADGNGASADPPAETFVEGSLSDPKRLILTLLRVPRVCEHKPCRRSLRCVGISPPAYYRSRVICWERHRDFLQPFFQRHIFPALKAAQARDESPE